MDSTSVFVLEPLVLDGTRGKALAIDHCGYFFEKLQEKRTRVRAVCVEVICVAPFKLVGPGQKPYGLEKSIRVNERNSFVNANFVFFLICYESEQRVTNTSDIAILSLVLVSIIIVT